MPALKQWTIALLAVAGAFVIAGVTGSMIADLLGFWHLPGAGFAAALAVVATMYVAAPSYKLQLSCLALVVGGIAAWILLEPSWFPETRRYGALAYQPTHLPLIATCSGGIVGLLLTGFLRARSSA